MHEDDSSEPEDDSSEENSTADISDISTETTEESKPTETSQVLTVFNKRIHHEDDSSEDNSVTEIERYKNNGEQNIGKDNQLLTTNFQVEIENGKLAHNLLNRSTNFQIQG